MSTTNEVIDSRAETTFGYLVDQGRLMHSLGALSGRLILRVVELSRNGAGRQSRGCKKQAPTAEYHSTESEENRDQEAVLAGLLD